MSWEDPLDTSTEIDMADIDSSPYNIHAINPKKFHSWCIKAPKSSRWRDGETNHIFIIDSNLNIIEVVDIGGFSGWGGSMDTIYRCRVVNANEAIRYEDVHADDILKTLKYDRYREYHIKIENTSPVFHTFQEATVCLNFYINKKLIEESKKINMLSDCNEKVCLGKFDIQSKISVDGGDFYFTIKLKLTSFSPHGHDSVSTEAILGLQEAFSKNLNDTIEHNTKKYEKLKSKLVV